MDTGHAFTYRDREKMQKKKKRNATIDPIIGYPFFMPEVKKKILSFM